jgi:phosphatidylglycerophosphate synthase
MNEKIPSGTGTRFGPPQRIFPIVRYISYVSTLALSRFSCTPNQITSTSLIFGLLAAWLFQYNGPVSTLTGAGFFIACSVLDGCDGEIARLKNLTSHFGMRFDTFVDWIVHSAFFIALGAGVSDRTAEPFWLWCGVIAAVGGTVNYAIDFLRDSGVKIGGSNEGSWHQAMANKTVESGADLSIYVSRVIRSDFCFIVLALALADSLWILLPTGALGAQAYWMLQFAKNFRRHHV